MTTVLKSLLLHVTASILKSPSGTDTLLLNIDLTFYLMKRFAVLGLLRNYRIIARCMEILRTECSDCLNVSDV